MSAGKIRISQSAEAAILGWFRLAPTLGIHPGLREIIIGKFSEIKNECQGREFSIKSHGRVIQVWVQRSTDEAKVVWGNWYACHINVPSEDGSRFRTYLSLEGEDFWDVTNRG